MLKIIKNREPEQIVEYYVEFYYNEDRDGGFSFAANSEYEVDTETLTPEGRANYERCLNDKSLIGPVNLKYEHTYINPAVVKCSCGAEVILDGGYAGAVQCECGRWYNLSGQELLDPEYWERDDDDYCFMSDTEYI